MQVPKELNVVRDKEQTLRRGQIHKYTDKIIDVFCSQLTLLLKENARLGDLFNL